MSSELGRKLCIPLMLAFSAFVSLRAAAEIFAPEDAYIDGSVHAYYGSENAWDLRFFNEHIYDPKLPGRPGQRQMLDIVDNKLDDAIQYCQERLGDHPGELESLFNLAVACAQRGDSQDALAAMKKALRGGLVPERFLAGPRDELQALQSLPDFQRIVGADKIRLLHGPMLGDMTDRSVTAWVRTIDETNVRILASTSSHLAKPIQSAAVATSAARDFTAIARLDGLEPDTLYYYDVQINGQSSLGPDYPQFRTYVRAGTPARFQVAFGGGAGYVTRNERMWDTLASHKLAGFLFLGDNVYVDLPRAECGMHHYTYYRRQSRAEYRRLVELTPIYAIWDDHDCATDDLFFGPYADKPSWKPDMWKVFRNNWNNPSYAGGETPGCWFRFSIADVDFFMLDGRYYRTNPEAPDPTMLGPLQKTWLLDAMKQATGKFKVLASPVPWAFDAKGDAIDTWNGFRSERQEIFRFLSDNNIEGVVLISADRHRSDARRIKRPGSYSLYEFESSNLTNIITHGPSGETIFFYNEKPSFGLLTFDTTKSDPEVTYEIVSIDDEVIHSLTLRRSHLTTR